MMDNNRGFTLIELLTIMAIIGILVHLSFSASISSRGRAGDAAAIAESKNLVTVAAEAFIDGEYANFTHAPGDGPNVGLKENGSYVFHLSAQVKAMIIGVDPALKQGYMEAYVYHAGGTHDDSSFSGKRTFYCLVDEKNGLITAPEF